MRAVALIVVALLTAAVPLTANAQGVLLGAVTDSNRLPLAGIEVTVEGTTTTTRTNPAGLYRLIIPSGTQSALFRGVGFRPLRLKLELQDREGIHADVVMVRTTPAQLDTVVVTAPEARAARSMREGFDERRILGLGKFIDSLELRRSEGRTTADVLRGYGVRIVAFAECGIGCGKQMRAAGMAAGCWVSVVLDGHVFYRSGSSDVPPDFAKVFRPFELDAIEYYRGSATIPMEFTGLGDQCGLLVLWTRRK